jgi:hypothetical protein
MFDGKDFLGEAQLGHTPPDQDVALTIGDVFDLKAERKREDFQLDRDGRTMSERISITLKNAKPQARHVRVTERLGRWTDWEIARARCRRTSATPDRELRRAGAGRGETTLTLHRSLSLGRRCQNP